MLVNKRSMWYYQIFRTDYYYLRVYWIRTPEREFVVTQSGN